MPADRMTDLYRRWIADKRITALALRTWSQQVDLQADLLLAELAQIEAREEEQRAIRPAAPESLALH